MLGFEHIWVEELAHHDRIVFTMEDRAEARGRLWRGADHRPAWTGRIVDETYPHEVRR